MKKQISEKYAALSSSDEAEKMTEPKIDKNWFCSVFLSYEVWICAIGFIMFACYCGPEHWYSDYLYTLTLCNYKFSISAATNVTSLFWILFTIGRFSGILQVRFFKPRTIVVINGTVTTIFCFILYVITLLNWPGIKTFIWISSAVIGFFFATTYPAMVSWVSEYISVTGFYAVVIGTGNYCGQIVVPLAAGLIKENLNLWFLYQAIFISGVLVFAAVLQFFGGILRKNYQKRINQ